jgi:hypothetical protein
MQWAVSIGRLDIVTAVMSLSSFHAMPRRGHLERAKQIYGYLTEITQPCIHTCNGLFICQLDLLPNLLEEMDCKEDTPLTLPFCIIRFPLTVDNSDMN